MIGCQVWIPDACLGLKHTWPPPLPVLSGRHCWKPLNILKANIAALHHVPLSAMSLPSVDGKIRRFPKQHDRLRAINLPRSLSDVCSSAVSMFVCLCAFLRLVSTEALGSCVVATWRGKHGERGCDSRNLLDLYMEVSFKNSIARQLWVMRLGWGGAEGWRREGEGHPQVSGHFFCVVMYIYPHRSD